MDELNHAILRQRWDDARALCKWLRIRPGYIDLKQLQVNATLLSADAVTQLFNRGLGTDPRSDPSRVPLSTRAWAASLCLTSSVNTDDVDAAQVYLDYGLACSSGDDPNLQSLYAAILHVKDLLSVYISVKPDLDVSRSVRPDTDENGVWGDISDDESFASANARESLVPLHVFLGEPIQATALALATAGYEAAVLRLYSEFPELQRVRYQLAESLLFAGAHPSSLVGLLPRIADGFEVLSADATESPLSSEQVKEWYKDTAKRLRRSGSSHSVALLSVARETIKDQDLLSLADRLQILDAFAHVTASRGALALPDTALSIPHQDILEEYRVRSQTDFLVQDLKSFVLPFFPEWADDYILKQLGSTAWTTVLYDTILALGDEPHIHFAPLVAALVFSSHSLDSPEWVAQNIVSPFVTSKPALDERTARQLLAHPATAHALYAYFITTPENLPAFLSASSFYLGVLAQLPPPRPVSLWSLFSMKFDNDLQVRVIDKILTGDGVYDSETDSSLFIDSFSVPSFIGSFTSVSPGQHRPVSSFWVGLAAFFTRWRSTLFPVVSQDYIQTRLIKQFLQVVLASGKHVSSKQFPLTAHEFFSSAGIPSRLVDPVITELSRTLLFASPSASVTAEPVVQAQRCLALSSSSENMALAHFVTNLSKLSSFFDPGHIILPKDMLDAESETQINLVAQGIITSPVSFASMSQVDIVLDLATSLINYDGDIVSAHILAAVVSHALADSDTPLDLLEAVLSRLFKLSHGNTEISHLTWRVAFDAARYMSQEATLLRFSDTTESAKFEHKALDALVVAIASCPKQFFAAVVQEWNKAHKRVLKAEPPSSHNIVPSRAASSARPRRHILPGSARDAAVSTVGAVAGAALNKFSMNNFGIDKFSTVSKGLTSLGSFGKAFMGGDVSNALRLNRESGDDIPVAFGMQRPDHSTASLQRSPSDSSITSKGADAPLRNPNVDAVKATNRESFVYNDKIFTGQEQKESWGWDEPLQEEEELFQGEKEQQKLEPNRELNFEADAADKGNEAWDWDEQPEQDAIEDESWHEEAEPADEQNPAVRAAPEAAEAWDWDEQPQEAQEAQDEAWQDEAELADELRPGSATAAGQAEGWDWDEPVQQEQTVQDDAWQDEAEPIQELRPGTGAEFGRNEAWDWDEPVQQEQAVENETWQDEAEPTQDLEPETQRVVEQAEAWDWEEPPQEEQAIEDEAWREQAEPANDLLLEPHTSPKEPQARDEATRYGQNVDSASWQEQVGPSQETHSEAEPREEDAWDWNEPVQDDQAIYDEAWHEEAEPGQERGVEPTVAPEHAEFLQNSNEPLQDEQTVDNEDWQDQVEPLPLREIHSKAEPWQQDDAWDWNEPVEEAQADQDEAWQEEVEPVGEVHPEAGPEKELHSEPQRQQVDAWDWEEPIHDDQAVQNEAWQEDIEPVRKLDAEPEIADAPESAEGWDPQNSVHKAQGVQDETWQDGRELHSEAKPLVTEAWNWEEPGQEEQAADNEAWQEGVEPVKELYPEDEPQHDDAWDWEEPAQEDQAVQNEGWQEETGPAPELHPETEPRQSDALDAYEPVHEDQAVQDEAWQEELEPEGEMHPETGPEEEHHLEVEPQQGDAWDWEEPGQENLSQAHDDSWQDKAEPVWQQGAEAEEPEAWDWNEPPQEPQASQDEAWQEEAEPSRELLSEVRDAPEEAEAWDWDKAQEEQTVQDEAWQEKAEPAPEPSSESGPQQGDIWDWKEPVEEDDAVQDEAWHEEAEPSEEHRLGTEPAEEVHPEAEPAEEVHPETEPAEELHPETESEEELYPETEPEEELHPETEPQQRDAWDWEEPVEVYDNQTIQDEAWQEEAEPSEEHRLETEPAEEVHPEAEPQQRDAWDWEEPVEVYDNQTIQDEAWQEEAEPSEEHRLETEPAGGLHPETEPAEELRPETEPTEELRPEGESKEELHPETEPTEELHPETEPTEELHPETEPQQRDAWDWDEPVEVYDNQAIQDEAWQEEAEPVQELNVGPEPQQGEAWDWEEPVQEDGGAQNEAWQEEAEPMQELHTEAASHHGDAWDWQEPIQEDQAVYDEGWQEEAEPLPEPHRENEPQRGDAWDWQEPVQENQAVYDTEAWQEEAEPVQDWYPDAAAAAAEPDAWNWDDSAQDQAVDDNWNTDAGVTEKAGTDAWDWDDGVDEGPGMGFVQAGPSASVAGTAPVQEVGYAEPEGEEWGWDEYEQNDHPDAQYWNEANEPNDTKQYGGHLSEGYPREPMQAEGTDAAEDTAEHVKQKLTKGMEWLMGL